MNDLTYFNAAKSALMQAKNIDEIKDIRDKAEAMRAYAKQAGDSSEMQNICAEIKLRAERRGGELLREMELNKGGRPIETSNIVLPVNEPTLSDMGIDKMQSSRWQAIAQLPEEVFEEYLAEKIEAKEEITTADVLRLAKPNPHVSHNSGDNEWYTPKELIISARVVMGEIDLDPASSDIANELIKARIFYKAEEDGLSKLWEGKVWMNPPYSQPLVARFCEKLTIHFLDEEVTEAIVLVNNSTETKWFQSLAETSSVICFPEGRVKFWHPSKVSTPLQGQAILYLGNRILDFINNFTKYGVCLNV